MLNRDEVVKIALQQRDTLLRANLSPTEKMLVAATVLRLLIVQFVKTASAGTTHEERSKAHIMLHEMAEVIVTEGASIHGG